ncbi:hypothetical protein O6H91_13G093600 [Diphasiastrum complanatum]|uniref:Uncharacterized protein n=1 Tax=Diphasiastrum complanatum TaxID=34168 RepID=A0ACC2BXF3_DIPCM|nr:hypothetical protein O6H91_13G093600 [Diphasiastrum complanatum]
MEGCCIGLQPQMNLRRHTNNIRPSQVFELMSSYVPYARRQLFKPGFIPQETILVQLATAGDLLPILFLLAVKRNPGILFDAFVVVLFWIFSCSCGSFWPCCRQGLIVTRFGFHLLAIFFFFFSKILIYIFETVRIFVCLTRSNFSMFFKNNVFSFSRSSEIANRLGA